MRNLVIFGDTLYAERLYKYIAFEKQDVVIAFTQQKDYRTKDRIQNLPVISFEELRNTIKVDFEILLGIGYTKMNSLRKEIFNLIINNGFKVGKYVSINAIVYTNDIGDGCFVCPGALIGPSCILGNGNFLASGTILTHDNIVGDFNYFSTNTVLGGEAIIGDYCFLGLHSTIRSSISIPSETLIGASANVIKSPLLKGGVFVGNPARQIEGKSSVDAII